LLTACPATRVPIRVHEVEELMDIWHGLQQSAVNSAIDGERVFASSTGQRTFWALEWTVIEAVKQCSKFVECVFQIG